MIKSSFFRLYPYIALFGKVYLLSWLLSKEVFHVCFLNQLLIKIKKEMNLEATK